MYALDLNVKERCGVDGHSIILLDELGQTNLVGILDFLEFLAEGFIINVRLKLIKMGQVLEVLVITKLRCDQLRQAWIGLVQPSSRGNAIGDIGEFVRAIDFDKVLEDGRLDQVRVELSNAVDLVGANNCQEGHAYHLGLRFLNDGDITEHIPVFGEIALNILEELHVDLVDDGQMAWQEMLHQWYRPLLQRLGHDRVIGVSERSLHDCTILIGERCTMGM